MSTFQQIIYKPIGTIFSGHLVEDHTPIQPVFARDCPGRAVIFPEYAEGLRDLDGFSHVYLLYHFHRVDAVRLTVKPFLQDQPRGLFATRAPCRPNPIGLSVVRLLKVDGLTLHLADVDILNETPLLDIKPYTSKFDCLATERNGWQDGVDEAAAQAKGRRDYRAINQLIKA